MHRLALLVALLPVAACGGSGDPEPAPAPAPPPSTGGETDAPDPGTARPAPTPAPTPTPTVDWAALRADVAAREPMAEFQRLPGNRRSRVSESFNVAESVFALAEPVAVDPADTSSITVTLPTNRCWYVSLELDGSWSELAARGGLRANLAAGGTSAVGALDPYMDGAVSEGGLCLSTGGVARLAIAIPELEGGPDGHAIGTGTATIQLFGTPQSPFGYTAEELEALVTSHTRRARGRRLTSGDLRSYTPAAFSIRRRHCHVIVMRLGEGAAFAERTRRVGVRAEVVMPEVRALAGPGIRGPGGIFDAGCHRDAAEAELHLTVDGGTPLGEGEYVLTLHSRPARPAELR